MNQRGEVLLPLDRRAASGADCAGDLAIEQGRRQLNRMAGKDSHIESVEPAGMEVVPRTFFDHDMVMNAIALPGLERTRRDLVHAHGARSRFVPSQWIP